MKRTLLLLLIFVVVLAIIGTAMVVASGTKSAHEKGSQLTFKLINLAPAQHKMMRRTVPMRVILLTIKKGLQNAKMRTKLANAPIVQEKPNISSNLLSKDVRCFLSNFSITFG
ncbi:MAG: hypothetical protein QME64_09660 [bacterium]|nr:hypothetical protein [bacterium]